MSDYDLGKAHGKIEIDADVDSDGLARRLLRIKDSVRKMGDDFQKAESKMAKFERRAKQMQRAVIASTGAMSRFAKTMGGVAAQAGAMAGAVSGVTRQFQDLKKGATSAATGILAVQGTLRELKSVAGVAGIALQLLGGGLKNVPEWARNIVAASTALKGLSQASIAARSGIARMAPAIARSVPLLGSAAAGAVLFRDKLNNLANSSDRLKPLADRLSKISREGESLGRAFRGAFRGIDGGLAGLAKIVIGVSAARKGFSYLMSMSKIVVAGFAGLSAVSGLASATSTAILGLASAIGQLSGAALLIPGGIMSAALAMGTLALSVRGLTTAMAAAWTGSESFEQDIANLPPSLKDAARAVKDLKPGIEGLMSSISGRFWEGLGSNIRDISKSYFPLIEKGAGRVAESFARMRHNLTSFLMENQTQKDFATSFQTTARIVNNFASSLKPALEGFRDLGIVGSEYLANMSSGMVSLSYRFKAWASEARNSGKAMEWIHRSVEGMRDLRTIIEGSIRGAGQFLKLFSKTGGDNGLDRAARGIERFQAAMERAGRGEGGLAVFVQRIQAMAETSKRVFDQLISTVKNVGNATKGMGEEFYQAFGGSLIQAISIVGKLVEILGKLVNAVPGLAGLAGTIMSVAAATKMIQLAIKPFTNLGLVMAGSVTAGRGLQQALLNLAVGIDKVQNSGSRLVAAGGKIQGGLGRMQNAALNLAGALSGPVVMGVMAAVAAISLMVSEAKKNEETNRQIQQGYEKSTESVRKFGEAIREANGKVTTEAVDHLTNSVKEFEEANNKAANNVPGFWTRAADIGQHMFGMGFDMLGDDDTSTKMDKAAKEAQKFQNAYKSLGLTSSEVAGYIRGNDADWLNFTSRLKAAGVGSGETMEKLNGLRASAQAQSLTAKAIGEDNLSVANGIAKLAEAGATATERLNALKQVMQGLGLIQTTAAEAVADWTIKTKEMADSAQQAFSGLDQGKILNAKGEIDAYSTSGARLVHFLANMREGFYATSQATGDAAGAYKQLDATFAELSRSTGISEQELRKFAAAAGILPDKVQVLLSIEGLSAANTSIVQVLEQLRNVPEGKYVTIQVTSEQAMEALKKAGVKIEEWNFTTKGAKILIPPGLGDEAIKKIEQQLEKAGVPQVKIKAAVEEAKKQREQQGRPQHKESAPPTPEEKKKKEEQKPEEAPKPPKAPEGPPKAPETPKEGEPKKEKLQVEVEGTDAAIGAVNAVRTALAAAKAESGNTSLNLEVKGTDAAIGAINAVRVALDAARAAVSNVSLNVELRGTDAAIGAANAVVVAVQNLANQVGTALGQAGTAVGGLISKLQELSNSLNSLGSTAFNSGAALGQGFANGIASKEAAVRAAAMKLAKAASDPLPRSPAKIGPFSGRGWTPFRGRSLAEGFAQGIHAGSDDAEREALGMVGKISKVIDSIAGAFGVTPSAMSGNKVLSNGVMFYRDPNISDEDLKERRAEEAKSKRKQQELEDYKLAAQAPKLAEDLKKAQESYGNAQKRLGEAKTEKQKESARKSLEGATERLNDAKTKLDRAQAAGDPSRANTSVDGFVKSLDNAQYQMGAFNQSMLDCSAFVSAVTNEATGRDPFSERGNTTNMRQFLLARGFKEGKGGEGDLSVAWWDKGGGANGHTALTTGSGLNAESTTGGVRFGDGSAGARSNNAQFDQFMYLPGGGRASEKDIRAIEANTGKSAELLNSQDDLTRKEMFDLRQKDKELDKALIAASNPRSNDAEISSALSKIEEKSLDRKTTSPITRQELERIRDSVVQDRGFIRDDPKVWLKEMKKPKAQFDFITKGVQNAIDLFNSVESGMQNAQATAKLLVRGVSSTDDIHSLVDGIQSAMNTVTSIMKTVGDMLDFAVKASTWAAAAGVAAIPGIGPALAPVVAMIGEITGIGDMINTVVDMVQEVTKIGGRFFGGALSSVLGLLGGTGQMQGQIKTLLDMNDNTIKTWSDRNAADKGVIGMGGNRGDSPNETKGFQNLNVYQAPGQDPAEMMNNAMFAVSAHSQGVYGG